MKRIMKEYFPHIKRYTGKTDYCDDCHEFKT